MNPGEQQAVSDFVQSITNELVRHHRLYQQQRKYAEVSAVEVIEIFVGGQLAKLKLAIDGQGPKLTRAELHELYRQIANGENPHGDFVTRFALVYLVADEGNQELLRPAAEALAVKYDLANKPGPLPGKEGL